MKKKILLILTTIAITMLAFGVINVSAADDKCSEWAEWSIDTAHKIGLLEPDKEYQYKKPVTREEFCEFVYNFLVKADYFIQWYNEQSNEGIQPLPPDAKRPFDDTNNAAVYSLYQHNFINGKAEGLFMPCDSLTREEAATIIGRVVSTLGIAANTESGYEFADGDEISPWAEDYVQRLCKLQIMVGVDNRCFAPKKTITTEQAITAVVRACIVAGISERQEAPEVFVLIFRDKDNNIIITEEDMTACKTQHIFVDGNESVWYVELTLSDDGRRKFKEGTERVAQYPNGENYISIAINDDLISAPVVEAVIDSDTVIISGSFSEESANEFAMIVNDAMKN